MKSREGEVTGLEASGGRRGGGEQPDGRGVRGPGIQFGSPAAVATR